MALAALKAKPLSPKERMRAWLLEISQKLPSEERLKMLEDILYWGRWQVHVGQEAHSRRTR